MTETLLTFHESRMSYLMYYIIALIIALASLSVYTGYFDPFIPDPYKGYSIYFLLISVILVALAEAERRGDIFSVTGDSITETWGVFSKSSQTMPFSTISGVSIRQSSNDKLFNIGTVELQSSSDDESGMIIKNAEKFSELIDILRRKGKIKTGATAGI